MKTDQIEEPEKSTEVKEDHLKEVIVNKTMKQEEKQHPKTLQDTVMETIRPI